MTKANRVYRVAELEDRRILERLLWYGDKNKTMSSAARGGHIEIVKLMLNLEMKDYKYAIIFVSEGGHKNIVDLMLERGANNYDWAMSFAAEGGYIEIVELMLELGDTSYGSAIDLTKKEEILK